MQIYLFLLNSSIFFLQAYASISFSSSQVHCFSTSIFWIVSSCVGSAGQILHGYCLQYPQCVKPFSITHFRVSHDGLNNIASSLSQQQPSHIVVLGSGSKPFHIFFHALQISIRLSSFSTLGRYIKHKSHRIPHLEKIFSTIHPSQIPICRFVCFHVIT